MTVPVSKILTITHNLKKLDDREFYHIFFHPTKTEWRNGYPVKTYDKVKLNSLPVPYLINGISFELIDVARYRLFNIDRSLILLSHGIGPTDFYISLASAAPGMVNINPWMFVGKFRRID